MTPEVRAIADRFIYEQATLKHMLNLVQESAVVGPNGRNLSEVGSRFAHLACSLGAFAEAVARERSGTETSPDWDLCAAAARSAEGQGLSSRADIARVFGEGLTSLFAELKRLPEDATSPPEALGPMSAHCQSHAIDLVDAIPEVRMDPLVLNWLLDLEFTDEASREWQAALLAEAREYVANHPDADEEDA